VEAGCVGIAAAEGVVEEFDLEEGGERGSGLVEVDVEAVEDVAAVDVESATEGVMEAEEGVVLVHAGGGGGLAVVVLCTEQLIILTMTSNRAGLEEV
jgi:hypothetical protein